MVTFPRTPAPTRHRPPRRPHAGAVAVVALVVALCGSVAGSAGAGAATPTSFTFDGGGWGHGVGMSQYGARGMATQGGTAVTILQHYYTGADVARLPEQNAHRVLVAPAARSFTFVAGQSITVKGPTGTVLGTAGAGATVTVTRSGSSVVVTGAVRATTTGLTMNFVGPVRITPPNHRYAYGTITVTPSGTSSLNTRIVGLTMRQLLFGLGEMPSLWPTQALRAQAIAARTFAQKRANVGGDLRAWMDISYVGYDKEVGTAADRWRSAVDTTAGAVLTYGGTLIDALFSASSGGFTENSEYVFYAALPWLRGVPDPGDLVAGNPFASWTRTFTAAELGSWFGVGTATDVDIVGPLGVSGRTNKASVRITGTTSTTTVTSYAFRTTVADRSPSRALISPKFRLRTATSTPTTTTQPPTTTTVPPAPPAPRTVRLPAGVLRSATANGRTITVEGIASDPDGVPTIRVVSTMGSTSATRTSQPVGGRWSLSWSGAPGSRTVCVAALDTPTARAVALGCRSVVVK